MKGLHEWMEEQFAEHKTEPNSGLGKAITYLLNHWRKHTLFLRQPGSPIDNNTRTAARGLCRVGLMAQGRLRRIPDF